MFSFRKVRETIGGLVLILAIVGMLALGTIGQVSVHTDNSRLSISYIQNKVQAAIVVTPLGTASDKASADPWTAFSSITLATGDYLFLCLASDPYAITTVKWNGIALIRDASNSNPGNVATYIYSLYITSGATGDVIIDWNVIPTAMAATLLKATGLDATPFDKSSTGTGSGTNPTSGATATLAQADELIIGAIGVEDEIDDMGGTWTTGAGYVSGNEQGTGTNGAGDASNIYIESAAEVVSATTAQTADMTGADNADWAAAVATYKMAAVGGTPDISNTPGSKALGVVNASSSYWSSGSEPSWPLDDAEAYFNITNSSGAAVDISIVATNFTGGNGWALVSGSPGSDEAKLKAGKSGDANEAAMVTINGTSQSFVTSLADGASKEWEVKLETGIFTDGVLKESTITLTAVLS